MSLLRPKDNAIFLKHLYERTRPAVLAAAGSVAALLLMLLVTCCFMIAYSLHDFPWARVVFIVMAYAHGFILLAFGTSSAFSMAVRERQAGTLDFHRVSPTSAGNIVTGLLLGAPILEWLLVLCTVPIAVGFALYSGAGVPLVLYLYASLALCALFFHALGLLGGLTLDPKKFQVYRSSWPMSVILALGLASLLGLGAGISPLCHATCLPAFVEIVRGTEGFPREELYELPSQFLYFDLPPLLLQAIIQVPLLFLVLTAAMRTVAHPERPVLSKIELLLGTGFLFFLFVGGSLPCASAAVAKNVSNVDLGVMLVFLYFTVSLGLAGAAIATPGALLHRKGLRRMHKEGRSHPNVFDDHASHVGWLIGFALLASVAYMALGWLIADARPITFSLPFLTVLCHVAWFSGALECFRLSKHHRKRSLFTLFVSVPWLFLPLFGTALAMGQISPISMAYSSVFSPLFGPLIIPGFGSGELTHPGPMAAVYLGVALAANLVLVAITQYLAWSMRRKLGTED